MLRILLTSTLVLATPALAQDFPRVIETKFGPVEIPAQPERVATVDYAGADNVLALGFQPVTSRYWFGAPENGIWPWAEDLLTSTPAVIQGEIDFEQLASTNPDVILALRSGITESDFARLSSIAPTIAVPPERGDYDLDWREQAMLAGTALGREAEAEAQIAQVETVISDLAAAHPDWQGKTFAMFTYYEGSVGLYTASDSAVQILSGLGLVSHPKVVELSQPGEFYLPISAEILPELDADVIFWYADQDAPDIISLPSRSALVAAQEGREIFLSNDSVASASLSHGSLLSIPYGLTALAPVLDAALDGEPATPAVLE